MGTNLNPLSQLTPQQRRIWLQNQDRSLAVQSQFIFEGQVSDDILQKALQRVFDRNPILRTYFKTTPGDPLPVPTVAENAWTESFKTIDLSKFKNNAQILLDIAREEQEAGFDLFNGPLMRTLFIRQDAHRWFFDHRGVTAGNDVNIHPGRGEPCPA